MTTPTEQQELEKAKELLKRVLKFHNHWRSGWYYTVQHNSRCLESDINAFLPLPSLDGHAATTTSPEVKGGVDLASQSDGEKPTDSSEDASRESELKNGSVAQNLDDRNSAPEVNGRAPVESFTRSGQNDCTESSQSQRGSNPRPRTDTSSTSLKEEQKEISIFITRIAVPESNVIPPAVTTPDEGKSLGQIAFEAFRADGPFVYAYLGDKDRWEALAQAVATSVCAVKDKEIEELKKSLKHFQKPFSVVMPWGEGYEQVTCEIADIGHADRILVVKLPREIAEAISRLRSLLADLSDKANYLTRLLSSNDNRLMIANVLKAMLDAITKELNP